MLEENDSRSEKSGCSGGRLGIYSARHNWAVLALHAGHPLPDDWLDCSFERICVGPSPAHKGAGALPAHCDIFRPSQRESYRLDEARLPARGKPLSAKASTNPPAQFALPHIGLSQVWVRFLIAIVGLVLAFGAALFSTVSRESGNIWTTMILASAALLLATLVGLTTVPYLALQVAAARVRDAMDYEVTRAGMVYMGITLVIGIASINTGNNLLYIVVAALLSAILVSGIASAVVLRHLE